MPTFIDSTDVADEVGNLNKKEIEASILPLMLWSSLKRMHAKLFEALETLDKTLQDHVRFTVSSKRQRLMQGSHSTVHVTETDHPCRDNFLRTPSDSVTSARLASFMDNTQSTFLKTYVCTICARECEAANVEHLHSSSIPNGANLHPMHAHPAYTLFNGMLLYPVKTDQDDCVPCCHDCLVYLRKNRCPQYSLANGLWLGAVPDELQILTLPEHILVARYYPAAYIVKLFPKSTRSCQWDAGNLNAGLRGNVSTYKLNTTKIAHIVLDQDLPPNPLVLFATIGVTIIAPSLVPEQTMPGFLRVRKQHVFDALVWLKANNPIYSDIIISIEHLNCLPTDGIPQEILASIQYSDETVVVEKEMDNYVPNADMGDDLSCLVTGIAGVLPVQEEDADSTHNNLEPTIVQCVNAEEARRSATCRLQTKKSNVPPAVLASSDN